MTVRFDLDANSLPPLGSGAGSPDEVHVWHTSLSLSEDDVAPLRDLLTPDERDRVARFIVPAPRVQYIASRAFLRSALGRYLQADPRALRFQTTAHGKPYLAADAHPGNTLRFNLSHSEGVAVLAVTRNREIGVDVERLRPKVEAVALANRFFSAEESAWLRAQPASATIASFYACWTAKEAYVKARGEGLSIPLSGFAVIPQTGNSQLQLEVYGNPAESRRWSMWQLDLAPDLRCALALEGGDCAVRIGRWPQ
jgi:4'-phosphopantetheinyl transferase